MTLRVVPCTITEARAFVERHHSHHHAPVGALCAVAVADGDRVCCVAILSRPVNRSLDGIGNVAEVTRLASDGTKHAASMCLAAITRAALALGWQRVISYTILGESGTSYRAAGWHVAATCKFTPWNNNTRRRQTVVIEVDKVRWETGPGAMPENLDALAALRSAEGTVSIPSRPETLPLFAAVTP